MKSIQNDTAAQIFTEGDYHEEIEFISVDFSKIDISDHTFENCTFSVCRFRETALPGAAFRNCILKDCELILVKLINVTLNDTVFKSCKIMGINFSECSNFGFSPEFHDCIINNSVFADVSIRKGKFLNCRLIDCDLANSDFRETDFSSTHFEHVTIHKCNFEKADFRTAQGYSIDPSTNQVRKAHFSLPEAQSFLSFLGIKIEH